MLENQLYGEVKAICWVSSKSRTIHAIKVNLQATVTHLEHAISRKGTAEETGKAKKLLQELTSVRFVKYLHFMEDCLDILRSASQIFQTKDLLLLEVPQTIEDTISRLNMLLSEKGDNTSTFYDSYSPDNQEYQPPSAALPLKLKGQNPVPYSEDGDIRSLSQNSIEYLENQFKNFSEPPLVYFNVFDYTTWPSDENILFTYGNDSIVALTKHFVSVLGDDSAKLVKSQWITISFLKKVKNNELYDTYTNLLARNPDNMSHILKLINIMMTLSPTTAECERQFSGMNLIKTNLRPTMSQSTLNDLMRIHSDGPSLRNFNPSSSIMNWLSAGPGHRHMSGHKPPQPKERDEVVIIKNTD